MQHHPEPSLEELLWTVAAARIIFGPAMNIQAPPNLTPAGLEGSNEAGREWRALLDAGINDWGGCLTRIPSHILAYCYLCCLPAAASRAWHLMLLYGRS